MTDFGSGLVRPGAQRNLLSMGSLGQCPGWLSYGTRAGRRDLDVAFGRLLLEQAPQAADAALRLAVLCSARVAQGDSCLDVAALYDGSAWRHALSGLVADADDPAGQRWLPPDLVSCVALLQDAPFVGRSEQETRIPMAGSGLAEEVQDRPLILEDTRLYLARYWRAARRIRRQLAIRLARTSLTPDEWPLARRWLDELFVHDTPGGAGSQPGASAIEDSQAPLDWQKIACATALVSGFTIITGGPGTGKTRTVVRLLVLLQGLALARGVTTGLRIRLAAPTGKAAARLKESVGTALAGLSNMASGPLADALARVSPEATTLHGLLGLHAEGNRSAAGGRPALDLEVLVIDEASMMDVEMLDAVLAALPIGAQLVLLGDKDQLPSVEAGAVLGELCVRAEGVHYTPEHCTRLQALCGQSPRREPWCDRDGQALDQAIVMLRHSFRFPEGSGIGRFARAVHLGSAPQALRLLNDGLDDLQWVPVRSADWLKESGVLGEEGGYRALLRAASAAPDDCTSGDVARLDAWALQVLQHQSRLQILCALREGPWGAQGLNHLLESQLRRAGLIAPDSGEWYPGRPVLVLRNQPALGLANGDIGVVLRYPDGSDGWVPRVAFPGALPGKVRWVAPARLPAVESVYALTIHKSQGSEFDHVVLVLPDRDSPLLTRELLYTGATRARKRLTLVSAGADADGLLSRAIGHRTQRVTGVWTV